MTGGESKLRKAIVEVVLRKHGIILKDWNAVDPRLIVIESDDDLRDLDPPRDAVVINGPCASGALEALGIRFRRSDQDGVTLKSGDVTYVLESPRFELRQPTKYSKWKAPQGEIQPPLPTSDRMPLVVFEASEDHAVPLLGKIERAGEGGWQPVCLDTPLGLVFGIDLHGLFLSSHRVPRLLCGFSRRVRSKPARTLRGLLRAPACSAAQAQEGFLSLSQIPGPTTNGGASPSGTTTTDSSPTKKSTTYLPFTTGCAYGRRGISCPINASRIRRA